MHKEIAQITCMIMLFGLLRNIECSCRTTVVPAFQLFSQGAFAETAIHPE
jgi:hypothetical protein